MPVCGIRCALCTSLLLQCPLGCEDCTVDGQCNRCFRWYFKNTSGTCVKVRGGLLYSGAACATLAGTATKRPAPWLTMRRPHLS